VKKCKKIPPELKGFTNVYEPEMKYCGIYFLYDDKEIVYIGQSINVESRIQSHLQDGKKHFNKAYFIPFRRTKLDGAEEAFVRMFRPKYNRTEDGKAILSSNRKRIKL